MASDTAAAGGGFGAVLIASGPMRQHARDAVALAGGRLVSEMPWDDVAAHLGRTCGRPVLLVEAEGADPQALADSLPRIDSVAAALDLQVVVSLGTAEIDAVTAVLLGGNVQLLCSPTLAERVAAIAVAGGVSDDLLHDTVREHEAERLARLNEEVARIAQVLARLTASEQAGRTSPEATLADRRAAYGAPVALENGVDAQAIRRTIRARRLRASFFDPTLLEDPGWDMLLDLFASELEGTQVSVSSLCIAAAVASTTALRWIGKMTDHGLFERQPDPLDRRRAFMVLTSRASEAMRGYVAAVGQAGVPIA